VSDQYGGRRRRGGGGSRAAAACAPAPAGRALTAQRPPRSMLFDFLTATPLSWIEFFVLMVPPPPFLVLTGQVSSLPSY